MHPLIPSPPPPPASYPSRKPKESAKHTDSSGLDHVADGESLDCLILGSASRAVGATDGLDVAAATLVAAAIGKY